MELAVWADDTHLYLVVTGLDPALLEKILWRRRGRARRGVARPSRRVFPLDSLPRRANLGLL